MKLKSNIRACKKCGGRFVVPREDPEQMFCPSCRAKNEDHSLAEREVLRVFGGNSVERMYDITKRYDNGELIDKEFYVEYEVVLGAIKGKVYIDRSLAAAMDVKRKESK